MACLGLRSAASVAEELWQLEREPRDFPELEIKREKGGSIDGWKVEDFEVKGYNPHKTIAMKMSV